jgi:hypothetical protein
MACASQSPHDMRHLLVVILLASCVDSSSDPQGDPPAPDDPEPEMQTPPDMPEPGTPTPATPDEVIARWQQCMTFADFQTANMANAWASMSTTSNQKCTSCHVTGSFSFMATTNAQQMFDVLKMDKYYLLEFVSLAPAAQGGGYDVIFNDKTIPSVAAGQVPYAEHPRFDATVGMNAARTFYTLTNARCATPI